ncbi:hypothetical protein OXX69_007001 [Metschnikowia pulcherrima]
MPVYIRSVESSQRWEDTLDRAAEAYNSGEVKTMSAAARKYGIPYRALQYHIKDRVERAELIQQKTKPYGAPCRDENAIQRWFDMVSYYIEEENIKDENIYIFDEAAYLMGRSPHVARRSEFYFSKSPSRLERGEWMTTIECANSRGWTLPPWIITCEQTVDNESITDVPKDWHFEKSKNGWTTDDIAVRWIKEHFVPLTKNRTKGSHTLLCIEGHRSLLKAKFDVVCRENNIVPVFMPQDSGYLLHPFQVGQCQKFRHTLLAIARDNVLESEKPLDVLEYLKEYSEQRQVAYTPKNIKASFAKAGLVPSNSGLVFEKFLRPCDEDDLSDTEYDTRATLDELKKHTVRMEATIPNAPKRPPKTEREAIDRFIDACKVVDKEFHVLERQLEVKRAAHHKIKQAWTYATGLIHEEDGLTASEMWEKYPELPSSRKGLEKKRAREREEAAERVEEWKRQNGLLDEQEDSDESSEEEDMINELGVYGGREASEVLGVDEEDVTSSDESTDPVEVAEDIEKVQTPKQAKQRGRKRSHSEDPEEKQAGTASAAQETEPRTRKARLCGICRKQGHRRETCPDRSTEVRI